MQDESKKDILDDELDESQVEVENTTVVEADEYYSAATYYEDEINEEKEEKKSYGKDAYDRLKNQEEIDDSKEEEQNNNDNNESSNDSKQEKTQKEKPEENKPKEENPEVSRNSARTKRELLQNKMNNLKQTKDKIDSNAYKLSHPGEALKDKAKSQIGNGLKKAGASVGNGLKAAGSKLKVSLVTALKGLVTNPYFWLVLGIIALIVFIFFLFAGAPKQKEESTSFMETCDYFSISTTTLNKKEFVERATNYLSSRNSESVKEFIDNLGKVYDISTKNNINPELVVVRAVNEGFSPGISKHNYWGMGCSNTGGYDACITYSTFEEGLLGFINNVSQYDSITNMMLRYGYIGKYWYNPGGSGLGGCYYFPYIRQYMSEARQNEVEKICSSNRECNKDGSGHCVPTNEEDQLAKTKGSVYAMAERRETIFGLPPDDCKYYSTTCTIFNQNDSNWASEKLGESNATMSDAGSSVAALATGISCTGTQLKIEDFNAGKLLNRLNIGGCFSKSGELSWSCKIISEVAPAVSYKTSRSIGIFSAEAKKKLLDSYKQDNHFIILKVKSSTNPKGRYVVYTKSDGTNFTAKDPSTGNVSTLALKDITKAIVYEYVPAVDNFTREISVGSGSSISTTILSQPLHTLLSKSEYNELNTLIHDSVISAGVGTRAAIVVAATTPIRYLAENYNVVIPYTWGGGHSSGGFNRLSTSYYGVDPNWGTQINYRSNGTFYPNFGPDCSGWVGWVYHNAGLKMSVRLARNHVELGTVHSMNSGYTAQPGDLLGNESHITVVVGVDEAKKTYYIAHASGANYGVAITPVRFNSNYYYIIDTSEYIGSHVNSNYDADFVSGVVEY